MIENVPFLVQGLLMFACQLIFLWSRTMNVIANSRLDRFGVFWTGAVVHFAWLATLYIGLGNLFHGNPLIILFSLSGGLMGADMAIKKKIKK